LADRGFSSSRSYILSAIYIAVNVFLRRTAWIPILSSFSIYFFDARAIQAPGDHDEPNRRIRKTALRSELDLT